MLAQLRGGVGDELAVMVVCHAWIGICEECSAQPLNAHSMQHMIEHSNEGRRVHVKLLNGNYIVWHYSVWGVICDQWNEDITSSDISDHRVP